MIIGRLGAEQGEVWCSEVEGFGWGDVQQMGGGVESLCPICRGGMRLKQKRAHHVVNGTNDALRFTVLRRGVGARHAKMNASSEEERAGTGVVELFPIVTLDGLYCHAKLCMYIGKEVSESRKHVRLES